MTDVIERNTSFVVGHKDKYRSLQRTTDFISFVNHAIELSGWSAKTFAETVLKREKDKSRFYDIVVLDLVIKTKRRIGDIVSRDSVFDGSDCATFDGDKILFATKEGLYVNIDQYLYLQRNGGLSPHQFFGRAEKQDYSVTASWKYLLRRSGEARKDRGVNIIYLSVGALRWEKEELRGNTERKTSPLFLCPVREDEKYKNGPRFTLVQPKLIVNVTLARLVEAQYNINIYNDIPQEFSFAELENNLKKVAENIAASGNMSLLENDMHICLLDSSNEMTCQAIERRLAQIVACPLVSVFSGAETYVPKYHGQSVPAVYPWAADDSQRELIVRANAGESLNVGAGPGAGKSQTCCNVIVNELLIGKRVCVISEKAAALEVIVKNMEKYHLENYCLLMNDKTTVKGIISQIKHSIAAPDVFVEKDDAKDVIDAYYDACKNIEKLNCIYDNIPEVDNNLYALIGEAIDTEEMDMRLYCVAEPKDYKALRRLVGGFQTSVLDTISSAEWTNFLTTGTTGDEEQDEMLVEAIDKIFALGLDLKRFVIDRKIPKNVVASTIVAQMSRFFAERYIEELELTGYGNKRLKMLYKKLLDASAAMQAVSAAFVRQEFCRRVRNVAQTSPLVELLDRLSTARISMQDFFANYGAEVLRFCPILIGTPNALVPYDSLNTFDVLIIDESSQMPFANVLPFLSGDRQMIVFGDAKQLDITYYYMKAGVYEQKYGEAFDMSATDKSILHVVQGKLPACQLLYHYRSKTEHLITVSNLRCYDGLLNIAPDYYFGRQNLPQKLRCELMQIDHHPKVDNEQGNLSEAQAIVDRVIKIRTEYPQKSVGIIVLNEPQQTTVNDEIDRRIDEDYSLAEPLNLQGDKLFLRTLENVQGKEADVIFISIGHYKRNDKTGRLSNRISVFPNEGAENKLNVLFTRAKEKIVVAISFSYKELRDSHNGVYRLYEYLRYIATGECDGISSSRNTETDRYNTALVEKPSSIVTDHKAYGKIGNAVMTVDVGLLRDGDTHYDAGLLFPPRALTPNAVCTKVTVLERAGWRLIPLSPITCFTKPEIFAKQIEDELNSDVRFYTECERSFLTETPPATLFRLQDFLPEEPEPEDLSITTEQLLAIDFPAVYERVFSQAVNEATGRTLLELCEKGDPQAKLKLYFYKLKDIVRQDRLSRLLERVEEVYKTEKLASYFYARLLQQRGDPKDAVLIKALLIEAKRLGINVKTGGVA